MLYSRAEIENMTKEMRAYFHRCVDGARAAGPRRGREIASEAGLCTALEITRDELRAMENGSDDERRFYATFMLEYEQAADVMWSAGMMPDAVYKELKATFRQTSTSDDKTIVLEFPEFNAPDDWEDYKALLAVLDDNGLTWKQGVAIIKKYVGGDAK